jgi:mannose-6-phosphate isomerase-like protein (cupin superfamily)/ketosteroid isomerase-like protein
MRPIATAILLLSCCGSAPMFAQAANESKAKDDVATSLVEMERQWAAVCATHDTSVLERILADDFLGTNTEGKHYTKSEDIEKIRRSTKRYKSGRLDDVKVRFYRSDIAVLHGVETCVRETDDGKEEPETAVWTDTWIERNGLWQIVAAQDAIYQTAGQAVISGPGKNATESGPESQPDMIQQVLATDEARRMAMLHGDVSALDSYLADDAMIFWGDGTADDKASTLALLRSGGLRYSQLDYDATRVRLYGQTAVVTGQAHIGEQIEGQNFAHMARVTRIYFRQGGRWRLLVSQTTRVPPASQLRSTSTQTPSETPKATNARAAEHHTSEAMFVSEKQLLAEIREAPEQRPSISRVDYLDTPPYTATVIRRTAPDRSEVHKAATEVQYVIEGSGILVTGGSLVEGTETEPDEIRGRGISGGDERRIASGDLMVIPAGTPHWVRRIDSTDIVYLSVKSTSARGGLPIDAATATRSPQSAGQSDTNSLAAEIIAAEDRYSQAYIHHDWAGASALLAPDYYGNAEGFEGDRTKLEQEFRKIRLLEYNVVSTPHLKLLAPDIVLYNDVVTMRETYGDRDISGRYWHGDIWVRRDGRWLLLVEQEVWLREPATATAEAELRATMEQCRKASLDGDTERVANCLADDYLQTDIAGYVQDKVAWLREYFQPLAELIKAGKFRWEVYDRKDVQFRMHGDSAVVVGTLQAKGSGARPMPQHTWVADPNATFSGTLRFTHLYIKRNGKWLLAALHNQMPPSLLPINN